jgi:hypothetical protein
MRGPKAAATVVGGALLLVLILLLAFSPEFRDWLSHIDLGRTYGSP